jgi:hypothetical protein
MPYNAIVPSLLRFMVASTHRGESDTRVRLPFEKYIYRALGNAAAQRLFNRVLIIIIQLT